MKRFLYFSLLILMLSSCDKDHMFDCVKSTGSITEQQRSFEDFNRLELYNNVDIEITQDVENSIVVEAGSNIISGITTEISDGVLTIRNENKCNWVRSYSTTMIVHLHVKKLDIIHHHGSGDISSTNQLKNSTFEFNIWNSGNINLSIDAESTYAKQHAAVGDMSLSGKSNYCFVYNLGNAFSRESNLVVDHCVVVQKGTGDCYVNVSQLLEVEIHEAGNVYYTGSPQITSSITGAGRLIHQ